jgi:hypothetical protein
MKAKEAASLAKGQKVEFDDGRSASVVRQGTLPVIPPHSEKPVPAAELPTVNVVVLELDDGSIGYLRWTDASVINLIHGRTTAEQ